MNVFDIIGPVMIGPSSSHTAGAARIGLLANKILDDKPVKAKIELSGSFANTHKGHGTDKALLAGIMGMGPDDERIRNSPALAKKFGLHYEIIETDIPEAHPNTARITLTGKNGNTCVLQGASVGGGNILVTELNGMKVAFTAQHNTILVLHNDKPGTIAAVTNFMAYSAVNIGNFSLTRPQRGGEALMTIEVDGEVPEELTASLRLLPNVLKVVLVHAI